jgi:ribose-phosphate pyrophosphokinase
MSSSPSSKKNHNTVIIAGSNSRRLANSLGSINDLPVLQHKITHFANSEIKITLPYKLEKGTKVWIVQSTSNPANDNLMELMLLVDTLKIHKIDDINVFIPYFGYSRQDKEHLKGECMSLKMISNILKSLGVKRAITCDIHNDEVLPKLSLNMQDQTSLSVLAQKIYKDLNLNPESESEFIVASPDQGGIFRSNLFAKSFFQNPRNCKTVSVKKERELSKIHYSRAIELYGKIDKPNLIIIDDVSTSGNTILNAIELCKANNVEAVYVVIVHADFSQGVVEKFENYDLIQKLYTTNTIEKPIEDLDWYHKVKTIDIAECIDLS